MRKSYPLSMINITNRCTLKCKHCFVFREGNPNEPSKANEMPAKEMVKQIKKFRNKYGIFSMVWMGGEPLLRKDVLELGVKLFPRNVITTNGTLPLINLGPKTKWSISIDGPEDLNDEIRGKGCFQKVMANLKALPEDFVGDLQCQCVITKKNQDRFEELVEFLHEEAPFRGMVLSFYVPRKNDTSEFAWQTLKERDPAVKKAHALKKKYPNYILNKEMAFELLLSQNAPEVLKDCLIQKLFLPLYLGPDGFEHPFCCYGNDVDCDMCGAWGAFHLAAMLRMDPTMPLHLVGV